MQDLDRNYVAQDAPGAYGAQPGTSASHFSGGGVVPGQLPQPWEHAMMGSAFRSAYLVSGNPLYRDRILGDWRYIQYSQLWTTNSLKSCGPGTVNSTMDDAAANSLYLIWIYQLAGNSTDGMNAINYARNIVDCSYQRWWDPTRNLAWYSDDHTNFSLIAAWLGYAAILLAQVDPSMDSATKTKFIGYARSIADSFENFQGGDGSRFLHRWGGDKFSLYFAIYEVNPARFTGSSEYTGSSPSFRGPIGNPKIFFNPDMDPQHLTNGTLYLGAEMGLNLLQAHLYRVLGNADYLQRAVRLANGITLAYRNEEGMIVHDRDPFADGFLAYDWVHAVFGLPGLNKASAYRLLDNGAVRIASKARTVDGKYGANWAGPSDQVYNTVAGIYATPSLLTVGGNTANVLITGAGLRGSYRVKTGQADFQNDGAATFTVFRPGDFRVSVNWRDQVKYDFLVPATPGAKPIIGNFDGTGTSVALYNPGTNLAWSGIPSGLTSQLGAPGDIPVTGDFDGDGMADVAVFRPGTSVYPGAGALYVQPSSAYFRDQPSLLTLPVQTSPGDIPFAGDFRRSGKSDFAVYRAATGNWDFYDANTKARYDSKNWGIPALGDKPMVGDFNGDGATDVAVFRPGDHTWWIQYRSSGDAPIGFSWGSPEPTDEPVVADFDGDGKDDYGIYHNVNGHWAIQYSGRSQTYETAWGHPELGDVPIPNFR